MKRNGCKSCEGHCDQAIVDSQPVWTCRNCGANNPRRVRRTAAQARLDANAKAAGMTANERVRLLMAKHGI